MNKSTNAYLLSALFLLIAVLGLATVYNSTEWGVEKTIQSVPDYQNNGISISDIYPHILQSNILTYQIIGSLLALLGCAGIFAAVKKRF